MSGRLTIVILIVAALSVVLLRGCVVSSCTIDTECMENSYSAGDRVLVSQCAYGLRLPLEQWWGRHRLLDSPPRKGDVLVFNDPSAPRQTPVQRRPVYLSRCIAAPGDTLLVDADLNPIADSRDAPDQKFLFAYPAEREPVVDSLVASLVGIRPNQAMRLDSVTHLRCLSRYEHYLLQQAVGNSFAFHLTSAADSTTLTRPMVIPKKGEPVVIRPWNRDLLCRALVEHEGRNASIIRDTLFVDGLPVRHWQFTQDYCWVVADNPLHPCDTKQIGLVPQSHLIGRVVVRWHSAP